MSTINRFLATGRGLLAIEKQLGGMHRRDPDWAPLGRQCEELRVRQQEEIVAAVESGVTWELVKTVLAFHGQGADRDQFDGRPTPAEELGELLRVHGAEKVVRALDAMKAARAA